jgi:prepilin-type N-terminal cleavage/methylation domain-containing protein
MEKNGRSAFTLIELLIVVAIIAILAAIAVPNFLEAQTRSKISRVHSDFRAVGIACESYMVDQNGYPACDVTTGFAGFLSTEMNAEMLDRLTTPVSYLTSSRWKDAFFIPPQGTSQWNPHGYYQYQPYNLTYFGTSAMNRKAFIIFSFGPDRLSSSMDWIVNDVIVGGEDFLYAASKPRDTNGYYGTDNGACIYDPTNGTKSRGDIGRCGGDLPGFPQVIGGGAH